MVIEWRWRWRKGWKNVKKTQTNTFNIAKKQQFYRLILSQYSDCCTFHSHSSFLCSQTGDCSLQKSARPWIGYCKWASFEMTDQRKIIVPKYSPVLQISKLPPQRKPASVSWWRCTFLSWHHGIFPSLFFSLLCFPVSHLTFSLVAHTPISCIMYGTSPLWIYLCSLHH